MFRITTGLILLHVSLLIVAFLIMLNGYLRGRLRRQIDAGLSIVWLILLSVGFFQFGWKAGALAVVLSFIYALLARPFAATLARKLLGYRTGIEVTGGLGRPSGNFFRSDISVEEWLKRSENEDQAREKRIERIAQRKDILQVLRENEMGAEDLGENFWFLNRIGLGDLAWDIIASPKDLRRLLHLRKELGSTREGALEIAHKMRIE